MCLLLSSLSKRNTHRCFHLINGCIFIVLASKDSIYVIISITPCWCHEYFHRTRSIVFDRCVRINHQNIINFMLIGRDFIIIFFQYDIIIRGLFRGKNRLNGYPELLSLYTSFTTLTKVDSLVCLINGCRDIPLYLIHAPPHKSVPFYIYFGAFPSMNSLTEFRIHICYLRLPDNFWFYRGIFLHDVSENRWKELPKEKAILW